MMNSFRKNKSGFTLIELLVVISIIAVLMSIMMPAMGKARDLAKTIVGKSNQKQLGVASNLYASDYEGKLPSAYPWHKTLNPTGSGYWFEDADPAATYSANGLVECPGLGKYVDLQLKYDEVNDNYTPEKGSILWCPACTKKDLDLLFPRAISIGMNFEFSTRSVATIPRASEYALFADANFYAFHNDRYTYKYANGRGDAWKWDYYRTVNGQEIDVLPGRHNGNSEVINLLYIDGHAASLAKDKLTEKMIDDNITKK